MRNILIVCSLLGLFCVGTMVLVRAGTKVTEESISGRSYPVIQTAIAELARYNLDVSRYRITVKETETSWFVTLIDADVPDDVRERFRGDPGKIPGFVVELERDNLRVVRSNFIR